MTIREISELLGVSKTFLYAISRDFPAEVPKNKTDLWRWEEFIHNHRIEPTG
jgi:hypothetical protein